MRKTFYDGIINSVLMIDDALTAKTMSFTISLGTRAVSVNVLTDEALKGPFSHGKILPRNKLVF